MNFIVETSEAAQAEIEAAFLRLSAYDPSFAGRWLEGLTQAIEALETLPRRHEKISMKGHEGRETRRMLYRNGRTAYRVVFILLDNDDDGEKETVRVLQVRSAAQFRGQVEFWVEQHLMTVSGKEIVARYLKDKPPSGATLEALTQGVRHEQDWQYVPVRPSFEPPRQYEYYEALADVEGALEDEENLPVLFLLTAPEHEN